MNNLSSYCGLVDAKIRASDKDLHLQFVLHKVDITEVASEQFPIWIFYFWTYVQLSPQGSKREKNPIMNYEQFLSSAFSCFHGQKSFKIF
jgi:hypothetical protein